MRSETLSLSLSYFFISLSTKNPYVELSNWARGSWLGMMAGWQRRGRSRCWPGDGLFYGWSPQQCWYKFEYYTIVVSFLLKLRVLYRDAIGNSLSLISLSRFQQKILMLNWAIVFPKEHVMLCQKKSLSFISLTRDKDIKFLFPSSRNLILLV